MNKKLQDSPNKNGSQEEPNQENIGDFMYYSSPNFWILIICFSAVLEEHRKQCEMEGKYVGNAFL